MIKNHDIGVSETIGFVLILGIVMTGIGIVTLYGYPALLQQQQNANSKNMEKNMIVLQNDAELLAYKSVTYRETAMQISGGSLQVINPSISGLGSSNFLITITPSALPQQIYRFYPGLLQFNSNSANEIIALQNGAVVTNGFSEDTTGSSTMLSEPRWFLDTDLNGKKTLVISIINFTSDGDLSTSEGIGTVQMNITQGNTIEITDPSTVDILYTDSGAGYRKAWENYFHNTQVFPGSTNPGLTELQISGVDRTVIKLFNVKILNL